MEKNQKKTKKKRVSVYGVDADGQVSVLKRYVTEEEAAKIANDHFRKTGRTAITVKVK